jgi:hypothetical protein
MDIAATFRTWLNVLTHPSEETFAQERQKPEANLTTALIWIVIAAVVSAVFGFITAQFMFAAQGPMLSQMFDQMDLPPEARDQITQLLSSGPMAGMMGGASVFSIILAPIFFLIWAGILHLVAQALGGSGDYGRYAYLLAVFQAPLTIILAIIGLVPFLGGCLGFIGWIYGLVLTYYATKVEYNLPSGRAIAVVIIPMLVVLAFFACIAIAFAGMFAALFSNR